MRPSSPSESQRKRRGRSPGYPAIDLKEALERAFDVWDLAGKEFASANEIIGRWGLEASSGRGRTIFAALIKYGLLEAQGSGKTREGRLSALARDLLRNNFESQQERLKALQKAALLPPIHRALWENYNKSLPADDVLLEELVSKRAFTASAAGKFVKVFRESLAFAALAGAYDPSAERRRLMLESKWMEMTSGLPEPGGGSLTGKPITDPSRGRTITFPLPGGSTAIIQFSAPLTMTAVKSFYEALALIRTGMESWTVVERGSGSEEQERKAEPESSKENEPSK